MKQQQKDIALLVFLASIFLFSIFAVYHRGASLMIFTITFLSMIVFYQKNLKEAYDKMDFFPWNEVNLVKKRHPESTVIDCGWYLDQYKSDNIFHMSDPVVSKYNTDDGSDDE